MQNAVRIPECGDQICKKLRGHYIYLSTKKSGSHVVEKCMESCSSAVMHAIEEILEKKQALELARNKFGNYVIQTALRATHEVKQKILFFSYYVSVYHFFYTININVPRKSPSFYRRRVLIFSFGTPL